jgi:hypothetical protein
MPDPVYGRPSTLELVEHRTEQEHGHGPEQEHGHGHEHEKTAETDDTAEEGPVAGPGEPTGDAGGRSLTG